MIYSHHHTLRNLRRLLLAITGLLISLTAMAQARFASDTALQSMGQIEWKHPATARYVITNTGDQPLILTEVAPDCACTVAAWTEEPIAPGGQGEIRVEFDAEMLGHFHKSVLVYTNAEPHVVELSFAGEVVRQRTDYTATHPYLIGDIRIDRRDITFPDSRRGERPVVRLDVANGSDHALELVLMHLPPYVEMTATPAVVGKGGSGVITLTLDAERLSEVGLTQTSVYLSRFGGDRVGPDNELPLSVVILPDFSGLTPAERARAPHIGLSATEVDLGAAAAAGRKHVDITISNTGQSALHIDRLQTSGAAVSVKLRKTTIAPGETTRLRISPNRQAGRELTRLLLITNDPAQPKVEIAVRP